MWLLKKGKRGRPEIGAVSLPNAPAYGVTLPMKRPPRPSDACGESDGQPAAKPVVGP